MSSELWAMNDERNWKTSGNCDWERVEPSLLGLCRTDERDKSRGCLHTMPCKEEEDKVNVSNLDKVKDGKMNSRGFSNPWDKDIYIHLPSAKTGIGGKGCRSASLQTHFPSLHLFPRVQEPAAIRPSGFPSFRRFSLKNVWWVMSDEGGGRDVACSVRRKHIGL